MPSVGLSSWASKKLLNGNVLAAVPADRHSREGRSKNSFRPHLIFDSLRLSASWEGDGLRQNEAREKTEDLNLGKLWGN
jgi:hypothetical protein